MSRDLKIGLLLLVITLTFAGIAILRRGTQSSQISVRDPAAVSDEAPEDRNVQSSPVPISEYRPFRLTSVLDSFATNGFAFRVKELEAIKGDLAKEEIEALYEYLLTPSPTNGPNRQFENWLRHKMMEKLVGQSKLPDGLGRTLMSIYSATEQDVVMRDYALQHLGPLYNRFDNVEQEALRPLLWEAVTEVESSIAGTALLALGDLAQNYPQFSRTRLSAAALKIASDSRSGELARITALQICGRLGLRNAEGVALRLAQESGSLPLQISAMAALGDVGGEQSRSFLEVQTRESHERLREAAVRALERLNRRLGI